MHQFVHRQVDRLLAALREAQTGCLQQVATADTLSTPEVDQALGPAGVGFAQAFDIAEGRGVGPGIEVGKGGVVTQTHTQGKLDRCHAVLGGSPGPLLDCP
ncbi:hypothetical protein D3C76_1408040 [compost metagenome]